LAGDNADVLAADRLLTLRMSWLQTQQMSWLQTNMWLPKKAASGGLFPAKTTTFQTRLCILIVFDG
jgi:hypothetical protein